MRALRIGLACFAALAYVEGFDHAIDGQVYYGFFWAILAAFAWFTALDKTI